MKKIFSGFLALTVFFLLALTGCDNINIVDSNYRDPLNAYFDASSNAVSISIPHISDETKYITIYRFNSAKTVSNSSKGVVIGVIYPQNWEQNNAYTFNDHYPVKNCGYYYRARYYTSDDDYSLTTWSQEVSIPDGKGIDSAFKPAEVDFDYDSNTYVLSPLTDIEISTDSEGKEFIPMLVFTKTDGSASQAIEIPSGKYTANSEIDLRSLLPSSLFDSNLTIEGIVGKYEIKTDASDSSDSKIRSILFTEIQEVKVAGSYTNVIKIDSQNGEGGVDFS